MVTAGRWIGLGVLIGLSVAGGVVSTLMHVYGQLGALNERTKRIGDLDAVTKSLAQRIDSLEVPPDPPSEARKARRWCSVIGDRSADQWYTNGTNADIDLAIGLEGSLDPLGGDENADGALVYSCGLHLYVDNVLVVHMHDTHSTCRVNGVTVPAATSYRVTETSGTIAMWQELRSDCPL